ncbi:hypothetical protein [Sphingobacterium olei]|uniref:hypothetical protein n=1 Tax=Sphingobacterium olei TaxID=2571155 RepID=UPI001EE45C26|nr:hypothetical protein [Sphingobacterium olei]
MSIAPGYECSTPLLSFVKMNVRQISLDTFAVVIARRFLDTKFVLDNVEDADL